jgi:hypothetical protein
VTLQKYNFMRTGLVPVVWAKFKGKKARAGVANGKGIGSSGRHIVGPLENHARIEKLFSRETR